MLMLMLMQTGAGHGRGQVFLEVILAAAYILDLLLQTMVGDG